MLMLSMFQWWYTHGWSVLWNGIKKRFSSTADYFSIGLLLKTLFAPFRQISAGHYDNAPLGVNIRAFFDRLFSRIIGAVIRLFILIAGVVVLLIQAVISLVLLILWPLIPLGLPAGVILMVVGV